jgi:hypothetical protein
MQDIFPLRKRTPMSYNGTIPSQDSRIKRNYLGRRDQAEAACRRHVATWRKLKRDKSKSSPIKKNKARPANEKSHPLRGLF